MSTRVVILAVSMAMVSITASAGLVSMETYTDSNGFFRYTLKASEEPYRWGGRMQMLALRLPARRIMGIVETPNWVWSTNDPDAILWQYIGSTAYVVHESGVTFAYTSAWFVVTAYDDLSPTGEYPCATVVGEVYDTNGMLYTSVCTNAGSIVSVNVAGYERVPFVGPMVPEAGGTVVVGEV